MHGVDDGTINCNFAVEFDGSGEIVDIESIEQTHYREIDPDEIEYKILSDQGEFVDANDMGTFATIMWALICHLRDHPAGGTVAELAEAIGFPPGAVGEVCAQLHVRDQLVSPDAHIATSHAKGTKWVVTAGDPTYRLPADMWATMAAPKDDNEDTKHE